MEAWVAHGEPIHNPVVLRRKPVPQNGRGMRHYRREHKRLCKLIQSEAPAGVRIGMWSDDGTSVVWADEME